MVPSRARYKVVAFGVTLAILAFVDRVCISQAAPLISKELGFDKAQMGNIFGAFLLTYALFEIPGAWYGDFAGPRRGLMRIVVGWSAFTALTGAAWSYWSMYVIRLLFGVGEAGAFPIITKSFATWLPAMERTRAQGILWTAARWGGAFTPLLVVWVLQYVSWRWSFVLFGALGCVWALLFYWWYRDRPQDHPEVNAAELALLPAAPVGHESVPWAKLLRTPSVLLLALQYFFLSFAWYFHSTWLPTYLQEYHKLSPGAGAKYAVIPLFSCGVGSLFCAFISPHVMRWTGSALRTRRLMACTGFLGAGVFFGLATQMPTVNTTMMMMAAACFFNDQVIAHAWASCMDIGGTRYASSVAGTMNLMGNLAGFASASIGGYILKNTGGDWNLFIGVLAAVYFLGVLCWPFIDTNTRLEPSGTGISHQPSFGSAASASAD